MKIKMTWIILLLSVLNAGTIAQDPAEIVKKSRDIMKVSAFEATSTLTITDARGNQRIRESTMASKSYPGEIEKRIIKFTHPPEIRGTGMLIVDYPEKTDDQWIYLPAMRKTRRIVSREKSRSFMGSEFSNADMTAPGLQDFSYQMEPSRSLRNTDCFVIRATPVSNDLAAQYGYASSLLWIGKEDHLMLRKEFLSADGSCFKTIDNLEIDLLDTTQNRYMVTRMKAVNHRTRRESEMVMERVDIRETRDTYFTVSYLEQ